MGTDCDRAIPFTPDVPAKMNVRVVKTYHRDGSSYTLFCGQLTAMKNLRRHLVVSLPSGWINMSPACEPRMSQLVCSCLILYMLFQGGINRGYETVHIET